MKGRQKSEHFQRRRPIFIWAQVAVDPGPSMPNVNSVPSRLRRPPAATLAVLIVFLFGGTGSKAATPLDDALELFSERRYAEAEIAFESLFEKYPDHPQVLLYSGKLAAKRSDHKLALRFLDQAMQLRPDDAEFCFEYGAASAFYAGTLGTSFTALIHARRASKALLRAIELAPDDLAYRQGMIEFSLNAPSFAGGGYKRANAQAEVIVETDAARGTFAFARIHRAQGDHTAAMVALDELIAMAPHNYFARFHFGRCAAESGERLVEGVAHLQKCLTLPAPDRAAPPAEVWWNIATIRKQQNDREAAIDALEQALALAPQHHRIAEDLARFLAEES